MRFVFDIHGKTPQVTASTKAYSLGRVDQPPQWRGSRAEVLIVDCIDWDTDQRREGDAIYIEGDTDAVRKAFSAVLSMLDFSDEHARKSVDEEIARSVVCPRCQRWADAKNEWHGNGHGLACYGLADVRLSIIQAEVAKAATLQSAEDARELPHATAGLEGGEPTP